MTQADVARENENPFPSGIGSVSLEFSYKIFL
jgi:hypothetical protein